MGLTFINLSLNIPEIFSGFLPPVDAMGKTIFFVSGRKHFPDKIDNSDTKLRKVVLVICVDVDRTETDYLVKSSVFLFRNRSVVQEVFIINHRRQERLLLFLGMLFISNIYLGDLFHPLLIPKSVI